MADSVLPLRRSPLLPGLVVLAVAVVAALAVAFYVRGTAVTSSQIPLTVDPLTIDLLFAPPNEERDVEIDAQTEALSASDPELDARVEGELGIPVTISGSVLDAEAQQLLLTVDAGDAVTSMQAAPVAAQTMLDLRAEDGIARGEGGISAVEATLAELRQQRIDFSGTSQTARLDRAITDQEASLQQQQDAIARLSGAPNGTLGAASDPRLGPRDYAPAVFAFVGVAALGAACIAFWRRWSGPVRPRGTLVAGELPVELDEDGLRAFVLEALLSSPRSRGTVLVLLGFEHSAAPQLADRLVAALPRGDRAVVVDPGAADAPDLRAIDPDDVPVEVDRYGLSVGTGDLAGVIGTPRTARGLAALTATHDLVVVASPAAPVLGALAWSAHADRMDLVVVRGRTLQLHLRRVRGDLRGRGLDPQVLLVAPPLLAGPPNDVAEPGEAVVAATR